MSGTLGPRRLLDAFNKAAIPRRAVLGVPSDVLHDRLIVDLDVVRP